MPPNRGESSPLRRHMQDRGNFFGRRGLLSKTYARLTHYPSTGSEERLSVQLGAKESQFIHLLRVGTDPSFLPVQLLSDLYIFFCPATIT